MQKRWYVYGEIRNEIACMGDVATLRFHLTWIIQKSLRLGQRCTYYLGAILANKQYTWSGEAIVKSVFLPFRLLKACQADEKSAYVLTQSHVLLEHVKLALKENMPSKAKLPKF